MHYCAALLFVHFHLFSKAIVSLLSSMSPSLMLRAAAKATFTTHVLVSGVSLLHGTFADSLPPDKDEGWLYDKNAKNFAWLSHLDLLVCECYAGHGVKSQHLPDTDTSSSSSSRNSIVRLGKNATFEDAAVICSGPQEIAEAFRALKAANPEFLSHPHRISFEKSNSNGDGMAVVTYYMHQRYAGILKIKSLLRMHVQMENEERKVVSGTSGGSSTSQITKIEEWWNGVQPLDLPPFRLSRRINGLLSWYITSLFISD